MSFGVISPASEIRARQQFLSHLLAITGDTRLLWLPEGGDTTTSTDASLNGRTITYNATIAAQRSQVGFGTAVSFDGSTDFASTPDAAGLSFGTGSADSAFSVLTLAKVTDAATSRAFVAKYSPSDNAREWEFRLTAGDVLFMGLYDESVDVAPIRVSSSVVTQGAWSLFGGVYSAATGGATAANDITLYEDGVVKASAATNQGTYVAMEDTAGPVNIGAEGNASTGTNFFQGDMAMVVVVAKALTASEMWAIYQLCVWYFNFLA